MRFSAIILLKILSVTEDSLADDVKESAASLKNNRIGQPKEHTTIDRDDTALASTSFFAQDEHHNVDQDSSSIVEGVVSSSVSSYNDRLDTGILPNIRSQGVSAASTSKQHYIKMTHAARMRHLASLVKQSDSPSTTFADAGSMPRLDSSFESSNMKANLRSSGNGQGHMIASVSEEGGDALKEEQSAKVKAIEDLLQKLKLLYCTKLSHTHWGDKFCKQDDDDHHSSKTIKSSKSSKNGKGTSTTTTAVPDTSAATTTVIASTTTVVNNYTFIQPAVDESSDAILIRGRNLQLQETAGLSLAAVEEYEKAFLQVLQQNAPAGTTVSSVVITSIIEGADGSLSFTFDATSVVDCPDPCDPTQAQAESAAALEDVLATSVSNGDFATALQANLVGVDCGTTFTCADLLASAGNATVAADITSLDVCPSTKVIVCENGNATSVGGVAVASGTTCQEACGGKCCVGSNRTILLNGATSTIYEQACEGLTASICMDGKTCMDDRACSDANVGSIFLGCYGKRSCSGAGENGYIGSITKSCYEEDSCRTAASDGYIGSITKSCVGGGELKGACKDAARNGYIGQITNSCLAPEACEFAGQNGGFIGQIVGSCKFEDACKAAAYKGNITLGIVDSCNAIESCFYTASYGGEINTIDNACNSDYACYNAARSNVGDIPSGIVGCCNTGNATSASDGICFQANEATLSTQDPTCTIASVSVLATADSDSDLINKEDEVELALGDFLTDLAHELYKHVKELAKNKKD